MEMENKKCNKKTKMKRIFIISGTIFAIIILAVIIYFNNRIVEISKFSNIKSIFEQATLKCYYNNIAEYETSSSGIFNYGHKKYWLEYMGIVTFGINVKDVDIKTSMFSKKIKIYVPDAVVLDCDVNENSMKEPIAETGIFTTITTEEKMMAVSKAQSTMEQNAKTDIDRLNKAKENAKKLIEMYVKTICEQMDNEYEIEWLSSPIN